MSLRLSYWTLQVEKTPGSLFYRQVENELRVKGKWYKAFVLNLFPSFYKSAFDIFEISVTIPELVFATHDYALVCLWVVFEC